jgi:hypothetical protein
MSVELGFKIRLEPLARVRSMRGRNRRMAEALLTDLEGGVLKVATRALERVRDFTEVGAGPGPHLRDLWQMVPRKRGLYEVLNRAERTERGRRRLAVHEFGSVPHPIEARPGRVLAFEAGGQVLFRRRVRHPGTRPYAPVRTARGLAALELQVLRGKMQRRAIQLWGEE